MKSKDIQVGLTYFTRNDDGVVRVVSAAKARGWWNTERTDGKSAGIRHSRNLLGSTSFNDREAEAAERENANRNDR